MVEIKRSFVGRNIGSRILSLLILENNPDYTGLPNHSMIGSWVGDRFYITADDYATEFNDEQTEYKNIAQEVVEMLAVVSPFDLIHYGGAAWTMRLVEHDSDYIRVTEKMAKRMLEVFGEENRVYPDDDLSRIIQHLNNR